MSSVQASADRIFATVYVLVAEDCVVRLFVVVLVLLGAPCVTL